MVGWWGDGSVMSSQVERPPYSERFRMPRNPMLYLQPSATHCNPMRPDATPLADSLAFYGNSMFSMIGTFITSLMPQCVLMAMAKYQGRNRGDTRLIKLATSKPETNCVRERTRPGYDTPREDMRHVFGVTRDKYAT